MSFIKSKPTTFKNTPVGVVAADTGVRQLKQTQIEFAQGLEKIAWATAKDEAIKKDLFNAKTLPIKDEYGKLKFEKINFSAVGEAQAQEIMAQRYSDEVALKSNIKFGELHSQYKLDKTSFDTEAQSYIDGFVKIFKDNKMDEYIPDFITKITNQKILHGNKILNDIRAREERIAGVNTNLKIRDSVNLISALQYDIENSDIKSDDVVDVENFNKLLQQKVQGRNILLKEINNNIDTLVANGQIKAPAIADIKNKIKRNLALGVINVAIDAVGENDGLIKALEQLFQSKNPSQKLQDYIFKGTLGKVKPSLLKKIFNLKTQLNLSREDIDVITREISDRAGDSKKLTTELKDDYNISNMSNVANGATNNINLTNDKATRNLLSKTLSNDLNETFSANSFIQLPPDKYNQTLKYIANTKILPNELHNVYKTTNPLNMNIFKGMDKKIVAKRLLDTWNNVAYTSDGQSTLQDYNEEYFKYKAVEAIVQANGGGIVKAFDLVGQIPATEKVVNEAVMATVNGFDADAKANSVDKALEFVLVQANVPRHTWLEMKPYAKKLLYYKQLKSGDKKFDEFSYSNVLEVLKGTYDNIYVEDETIFDLFNKSTEIKTKYTPKKKYIGANYNKFLDYAAERLQDKTGSKYAGLGEDVFLLPDYRNTQFGDQSYTFVNKIGVNILGDGGESITFDTKEFDKQNNIDTTEAERVHLNNVFNSRIKKIADSRDAGGLYKPNFLDYNFGDNFSPLAKQAGGFGYDDFKGGPVIPRQFTGFQKRMFNLPLNQEDKLLEKTDVDGYEMVNPSQMKLDKEKTLKELEESGFISHVKSLEKNYLETKIGETGFDNPSWRIIKDSIVNNFDFKDELKNLYDEFITPKVSVGIQDDLVTIYDTIAKEENIRNFVYVDRNTISLGIGFNVRFLDNDDYKLIPKDLKKPLKDLQAKLNKKEYTKKELVKITNDFKRKNIDIPKDISVQIFRKKVDKIITAYHNEFENFGTLAPIRQAALVDFSYQFGHHRLKKVFKNYYAAITKAINSDDINIRNYHFREAGFHQVYNIGEFGNFKTSLVNQTQLRVKRRTGALGFYFKEDANIDFLNEEFD